MTMWNIHGEPTVAAINIASGVGTVTTVITAPTIGETFVHALSVGVDTATTVTLTFGSRVLGIFKLTAFGTINLSDIVGMPGEPILKGLPLEAFTITTSAAAQVTGLIKYSRAKDI